jgi:uridine kinase|tara:strand:- start:943 stop:1551 length:609 start_codon:yes stop_codon:yes gene_type:complete
MLIIGIAGGTGSGKTTIVENILKVVPQKNISVITQDSYYNDTSHLNSKERTQINFDHPNSINFLLLVDHINQLKSGQSIAQPIYSFTSHNRTNQTKTIIPPKVLIIEGILIFNHKHLRDLCTIKIFVQAEADERLIRRVKRDIQERGRDLNEVFSRYQNTLKPMHNQFIEPTKEFADIIIPNDRLNTVAIDILKTIINDKLT